MDFKKIIITLIVAFVFADVYGQPSIAIGPKLGVNFSKLRGSDAHNLHYRTGFTGGLFVNVAVGAKGVFAVAPEVLFQHRGAEYDANDIDVTQKIKINYMTVPVPLKLRLPIDETFYPYVFAGPEFAFLLSDSYQIEHEGTGIGFTKDDIDARKGDVGGIFGAGLDIQSNRFFFNLELRYALGALSIDSHDNGLDLKTSQFSILTGVGIRFGG